MLKKIVERNCGWAGMCLHGPTRTATVRGEESEQRTSWAAVLSVSTAAHRRPEATQKRHWTQTKQVTDSRELSNFFFEFCEKNPHVSSGKPINWRPTKRGKVWRTASGFCLTKTFATSKTATGASGSSIQTIWKSLSTNANASQASTSRRRRCCSSWSKRKRRHSPKKIERSVFNNKTFKINYFCWVVFKIIIFYKHLFIYSADKCK